MPTPDTADSPKHVAATVGHCGHGFPRCDASKTRPGPPDGGKLETTVQVNLQAMLPASHLGTSKQWGTSKQQATVPEPRRVSLSAPWTYYHSKRPHNPRNDQRSHKKSGDLPAAGVTLTGHLTLDFGAVTCHVRRTLRWQGCFKNSQGTD